MPAKPTVESRLSKLEKQMGEVLASPALRKRTERGVCVLGNEPSGECPSASLGKYQSGCNGTACLFKQAEYFREYRANRRALEAAKKAPAVKVAPPAKRTVKRAQKATEAPLAEPVKRGVKRRRG